MKLGMCKSKNLRFEVCGLWFEELNDQLPVSGIWYPVSGIRFPASGILLPVSAFILYLHHANSK